MKRKTNLYKEVCNLDNLILADKNAQRTVTKRIQNI